MKKYGWKYFFFLLPFAVAIGVELFVLPADFFTFRVWETLIAGQSYGILKGPFYPDKTLLKTEAGGDLRTPASCVVKKKDILWQTDAYGYRKAAPPRSYYPVIVAGDSNIAGGGLSQPEMFSEVLEARLGKGVYPLAPESIKYIFEHGLLKQKKPEVVILAIIERGILTGNFKLPRGAEFRELSLPDRVVHGIRLHPAIQAVAVTIDRAFKANMIRFVKARINEKPSSAATPAGHDACPILFLQGAIANREVPDAVRLAAAQNIHGLSEYFRARDIRFIFLPIPNKENIYHKRLNTARPVFLEKLIDELQEMGVEVIDTQKAYEDITQVKDVHLYYRDDTHWNAEGVKVAVALVEKTMLKKPLETNAGTQ